MSVPETPPEEFAEIAKILSEFNQSHLLKYVGELNEEQKKAFKKQLESLDFKEISEMWKRAQDDLKQSEKLSEAEFKPIDVEIQKDLPESTIEEYKNIGLKEISKGTVGVIVLAGGLGTRLGMAYPKGICPTGIPSGKTLFQLQGERMVRLIEMAREKTGKEGVINWYVMTSESTHEITDKFLTQFKRFGISEENVTLFKQPRIPCFDFDGKILLEETDAVAMTPDGNGGLYQALLKNGVLEEMEKKGVKYVHVHSVDNILVRVADPVFIGKCVKDDVDCGMKVIKKVDPIEPLGLIVKTNNQIQVVEYSEIPETTSALKTESGDLVFNTGNICNHFFTVDFLKKVASEHCDDFKLHVAKKTVTKIGTEGNKVRSPSPNCIKIEKFVFDVVNYSQNFLAWMVERSEEFSPVKNNIDGDKDNFRTAKTDLLQLHKKWVEQAGGTCHADGIEVSPLLSYAGENLESVKEKKFTKDEIVWSEREEELQPRWHKLKMQERQERKKMRKNEKSDEMDEQSLDEDDCKKCGKKMKTHSVGKDNKGKSDKQCKKTVVCSL